MRQDAVTIEKDVLKLGEVSFPVDPKDILKSIDALEKQDTQAWKKMADVLGLPAVPFEKRLLKPVLMGMVQSAWYLAYTGSVPANCEANQKARVARYKAQLEELKNNDGKDLVVSRKPKADGEDKPRVANLYRLTEAKAADWKQFKGQKRLIVKVFEAEGAIGPEGKGITVKTISDSVRDTDETKAPSDKNCAFHINAWGHEGVVERVEEKDGKWTVAEVQKPKLPADEQPAPAEPKKKDPPKKDPPKDAKKKK